jgi:hypothetical protein
MAITADTVYAGARQTQYNPQPIGFYHNVAAADNSATTIVDDAMDASFDTLCTVVASTAVHTTDVYDAAVYVDATLVGIIQDVDASQSFDVVVPLGTNLKVNMSNQTDSTDQNVQVYVLIKQLQGTSST